MYIYTYDMGFLSTTVSQSSYSTPFRLPFFTSPTSAFSGRSRIRGSWPHGPRTILRKWWSMPSLGGVKRPWRRRRRRRRNRRNNKRFGAWSDLIRQFHELVCWIMVGCWHFKKIFHDDERFWCSGSKSGDIGSILWKFVFSVNNVVGVAEHFI